MSNITIEEVINILEKTKHIDNSILQFSPKFYEAIDFAIDNLKTNEAYNLIYEDVNLFVRDASTNAMKKLTAVRLSKKEWKYEYHERNNDVEFNREKEFWRENLYA